MFEEYRAPASTSDAWRALADRVREVLDAAGIPSHFAEDLPRPAGAEIEIDHGNDEMGGVFVDWRPGAALVEAVNEATAKGRASDPAIRRFMAITTAMRDAMIGVLRDSGLEVIAVDDYAARPPAVQVVES